VLGFERRQDEIGDADFAGHQLVQQSAEQLFEDGLLTFVQVNFGINGVEDCRNLILLFTGRRYRD